MVPSPPSKTWVWWGSSSKGELFPCFFKLFPWTLQVQPKQCTIKRGTPPQMHHTFAASLIPPFWGNLMIPARWVFWKITNPVRMMSFLDLNGDDFGITSLTFPPIHSLQSLNPWMLNKIIYGMEHHGRKTYWVSDFLILDHALPCFILTIVHLSGPFCVPKQSATIEGWKVTMLSSNHRLFPTPRVSTAVDLKPGRTKKSQEAFTERGGHTQMIQMIPDSPFQMIPSMKCL